MEKIKVKTCILFFVLVFFAVIFGGILGGLLAGTVNTKNVENFIEFNPALPTRLLDINGEVITEFASDEKREMISIDRLPQHMIDSLVTREDRIFYDHNGFSLKALLRAVVGKLTGRTLGGGSTLTQQIAGTLYCDRTEMSYMRKIKELWWAFQMERRYSKNEIMELYLNRIYFGGGTYGVNAASKYYFGHDATKITPAESAILVIQLSNPAYYNPFDHPNRARERQQDVLVSMVKNGYITQEQADESYDDDRANFCGGDALKLNFKPTESTDGTVSSIVINADVTFTETNENVNVVVVDKTNMDDPGNDPGNDPQPNDKITLTIPAPVTLSADEAATADPTSGDVVMSAENGLKSVMVKVNSSSAEMMEQLAAVSEGYPGVDLVNGCEVVGNQNLVAFLGGLGKTITVPAEGDKNYTFPVGQFYIFLGILPGAHDFVMTVTDKEGNKKTGTVKVTITE